MDGLSVAANIIAVIEITGTITTICCEYLSKVKDAGQVIRKLIRELANFQVVLTSIEDLASSARNADSVLAISQLSGLLADCTEELQRLQTKLQRNKERKVIGRLLWPLQEGEVQSVLGTLERAKTTMTAALAKDQMSLAIGIRDDLKDLSNRQAQAALDEEQKAVWEWLAAPNPSTNHRAASQLSHEGTGMWFIESEEFLNWKESTPSFLWLYGISGCGKSILW